MSAFWIAVLCFVSSCFMAGFVVAGFLLEANVTESKPINKRFYAVGWRDGYLDAASEAEQKIVEMKLTCRGVGEL